MRFLGGLIVGLVLGFGGYLGYQQYALHSDPCLGRCGQQTACIAGVCLLQQARAATETPGKRRRWHRRRRLRPTGPADPRELTLRQPTARDLKPVTRGPALGTTDYINMTRDERPARELSSEEVEARFRTLDRRIVGCIDRARDGWDISTGRVTVSFRIERSGTVQKVRLAAPSVLQQSGLFDCVAGLVRSLRFPRNSRALVMSYPFTLK